MLSLKSSRTNVALHFLQKNPSIRPNSECGLVIEDWSSTNSTGSDSNSFITVVIYIEVFTVATAGCFIIKNVDSWY